MRPGCIAPAIGATVEAGRCTCGPVSVADDGYLSTFARNHAESPIPVHHYGPLRA